MESGQIIRRHLRPLNLYDSLFKQQLAASSHVDSVSEVSREQFTATCSARHLRKEAERNNKLLLLEDER